MKRNSGKRGGKRNFGNGGVGYGCPPREYQFKPGQSGNPNGRPKGSKNHRSAAIPESRLHEIVREEAYRHVPISDAKPHVTIPVAQAVVRAISRDAVRGKGPAQRVWVDLVAATDEAERSDREKALNAALNYKLQWERVLSASPSTPRPVPDPKDIHIDMATGAVRIRGPLQERDKPAWDYWRKMRRTYEKELEALYEWVNHADCDDAKQARREIKSTEQVIQIIDAALNGSPHALQLLEDTISTIPEVMKERRAFEARRKKV